MVKQYDFLTEKALRDKAIDRVEVLERVGELLLLPNTEYATTEQVAGYYKVEQTTIRQVCVRNNDELTSDGMVVLTGEQLSDIKSLSGFKSRARQLTVYPKRAILRVGMLLRDGEVAKEVRTKLLDIIHDVEQSNPEIVKNVVDEIDEEKQLMLERVQAEMDGNFYKVCEVNAKLFALKNKRIEELEDENRIITSHSLTILESKAVINRLVRSIAVKEFNGAFGRTWNEFYTLLNYKLGINIKKRKKAKGSYLNTLTEQEMFEAEKIARNWAMQLDFDIERLLKVA